MDDGVPATAIASALDVSRQRVYQIVAEGNRGARPRRKAKPKPAVTAEPVPVLGPGFAELRRSLPEQMRPLELDQDSAGPEFPVVLREAVEGLGFGEGPADAQVVHSFVD